MLRYTEILVFLKQKRSEVAILEFYDGKIFSDFFLTLNVEYYVSL